MEFDHKEMVEVITNLLLKAYNVTINKKSTKVMRKLYKTTNPFHS